MTALTSKTRDVLVELFKDPDEERTARDVATGAGVAANVAGNLLGRLIAMGFVVDRRTGDGTRVFRVNPDKRAEAAEVAGATLKAPKVPAKAATKAPAQPARVPVAATGGLPAGVTTVGQIRAAYARGEVSREFLTQVEREVARTIKPTR